MHTTEFPLLANGTLPQNHGYLLLSALSEKHPFLHGRSDLQIAPIFGKRSEDSKELFITTRSVLRFRGLGAGEAEALQFTQVNLQGTTLQLGQLVNVPFQGVPNLASRLVVLSGIWDPERGKMVPFVKETTVEQFTLTLARKLNELHFEAGIQVLRKRSILIKDRNYVGWSVRLSGLSPEESLQIQATGIGKFTSMGCGYFVGF